MAVPHQYLLDQRIATAAAQKYVRDPTAGFEDRVNSKNRWNVMPRGIESSRSAQVNAAKCGISEYRS